MSELTVVHQGVHITYVENDNTWCFELRGRAHCAVSLSKAKETIDTKPPKSKKDLFTRIPAFMRQWYSQDGPLFKKVTITSVADDARCWVVDARGRRSKELMHLVFLDTPENLELRTQVEALTREQARLHHEAEGLVKRLACPKVGEGAFVEAGEKG